MTIRQLRICKWLFAALMLAAWSLVLITSSQLESEVQRRSIDEMGMMLSARVLISVVLFMLALAAFNDAICKGKKDGALK